MSCIIYFVLVYPCFLRQQMFLAIEECRNQKGIGEQPCKRRGKTDDDVAKDRHQQEADHGAGDHFADTCQDGEQAVAHSLNRETSRRLIPSMISLSNRVRSPIILTLTLFFLAIFKSRFR